MSRKKAWAEWEEASVHVLINTWQEDWKAAAKMAQQKLAVDFKGHVWSGCKGRGKLGRKGGLGTSAPVVMGWSDSEQESSSALQTGHEEPAPDQGANWSQGLVQVEGTSPAEGTEKCSPGGRFQLFPLPNWMFLLLRQKGYGQSRCSEGVQPGSPATAHLT